MKIINGGIFLILCWVMSIQAAYALAEVRASATVNKSTVTLGDLLDNLEQGHDIWVMNSPAPGKKTSISTRYLASLTRQHNVYWQNSRAIRQIAVTRTGKTIQHGALEHLIRQGLENLNLSDKGNGITFENKKAAIHLPEDSAIDDITLQDFNYNQQRGKFSAWVSVPLDDGKFSTSVIRGRIHAISHVPALNKTIPPGHEITEQDIAWVSIPTLRIGRNIIRTKDKLIGMSPRRGLNSATPIKSSDLVRPKIITRGSMVNILYNAGKINLTAIGKAIENGGRGDMIRVMNSKSHKTIEAVVTGPGQVQVVTIHNRIAQLQ